MFSIGYLNLTCDGLVRHKSVNYAPVYIGSSFKSVPCWKEVLRPVEAGLRGGRPEASGNFLGRAISRISFILYLIPMGKAGLRGGRPEASGASLGRTISKIFTLLYLLP